MEEERAAGKCPVCERYIGPVLQCPYCGNEMPGILFRRVLRVVLPGLALAGIAGLLFAARQQQPAGRAVVALTPLHNYAFIQVEGKVLREPYLARDKGVAGYCSFMLDDGSGVIRVVAYERVAQQLDQLDMVPRKGALLRVCGSVRLAGGRNPALTVLNASDVEVLVAAGGGDG